MRLSQSLPLRFTLLSVMALILAIVALPSTVGASGSHSSGSAMHDHDDDDGDYAGGPPQLAKPKGESCIRPTDWMRRNHMNFLKHRRSETVREGVRVRSEGLLGCAECHTNHEKFCDQCHGYVSTAPDCFECHLYPD